jgi:SAM-dependent methyltransferase
MMPQRRPQGGSSVHDTPRKALTPANLAHDFGAASALTARLCRELQAAGPAEPEALIRQTAFSLLTKLIAWMVLSRARPRTGAPAFTTLEGASLLPALRRMEDGTLFGHYGIAGWGPEERFHWYTGCWTPGLGEALQAVLACLCEYDPLVAAPSADLLKALYQALLPRAVRHELGEYYTPDWLATHVLDQLGYDGGPGKRVLDPACGSGTFLVLALERLKARCAAQGFSARETLDRCLQCVAGIDLNPLAVTAARTNLMIALGPLLGEMLDPVELPIRQADAVLEPPADLGRFDYLAGNPPWVFWNTLPRPYRERLLPVLEHYGLVRQGASTMERLGSAGKDLSMLFVYVGIDRYLREGGRLGFVITQTLLQSTAGDEFRRFVLPSGEPFSVDRVEDMVAISPFSVAANKTALVYMTRGRRTLYPVPYTVWQKTGTFGRDSATLSQVLARTTRVEQVAAPSDGGLGFWVIRPAGAVGQAAEGAPRYRARMGVETKLESAFRVHLEAALDDGRCYAVRNNRQRAKRPLPELTGVVEEAVLYPYLGGEDIGLWRAGAGGVYIVPHSPETGIRAIPEAEFRETCPGAYAFLSRVRPELENRSLHRRWGGGQAPFYQMYDIGPYTFAPYKVVWKRTTRFFEACVVSELELAAGRRKLAIPNSNVMMIPFDAADEAHCLCAMLNSSIARAYINASITTKAHREIISVVPIPLFDGTDPLHRRLAALSAGAHDPTRTEDLVGIQAEIDELCAALWGVGAAELARCREAVGKKRS